MFVNSKKQVVVESRERSKHKDNVRLPKLEIANLEVIQETGNRSWTVLRQL